MADFYVDHDVAARVAVELRRLGHTAVTPRDVGTERASDAEHLLAAAIQHRMLVTHNAKDFRLLHQAWHLWQQAWAVDLPHAGILILPHGPAMGSVQVLDAFSESLAGPAEGQIYSYRQGRGWARIG